MRTLSSGVAFLALLGLSVAAQDTEKKDETPPAKEKQEAPPAEKKDATPTFDDLRGGLEKLEKDEEKKEEEKRAEMVRKNQQETLAIYDRALRGKNTELDNVTRRLQMNQALEKKYLKMQEDSRSELAILQARYVSRTLALKKSLDEGKISKEAYAKLLEEDGSKFRNREVELKDDLEFFDKELVTAREKIRDLSLRKEILEIDPFDTEKGASEDEGTPISGVADRVKSRVRALAGYRDFSIVDTMK